MVVLLIFVKNNISLCADGRQVYYKIDRHWQTDVIRNTTNNNNDNNILCVCVCKS